MTPAETLIQARALIAQDGAWTQGTFARDARGEPTYYGSHNAACFCPIGAILRISITHAEPLQVDCCYAFLESVTRRRQTINEWNDAPGRTQAEVVAAFDAAIKLAGEP